MQSPTAQALYQELDAFHRRPEPFSRYTTDQLWTDPHIATQMLRYHLDPETDAASRRPAAIDGFVGWLDRRIGLAGRRVCDLGCGPGLYTTRMAKRGAAVIGIDFSSSSVNHAREAAAGAGLALEYRLANYLTDDLPVGIDLFTMIYSDFCTLSPGQRRQLLDRLHAALVPGGRFVFDLSSTAQFAGLTEAEAFAHRLMAGFWSPEDYFGFSKTFLYPERSLKLDRYLIVTPTRRFEICNWLQHFDPAGIATALEASQFGVAATCDIQTGEDWVEGPSEFAVIAERR